MAANIGRYSLKWMNPSLPLRTSRAQLRQFSGIAVTVKSPESETSSLSSFTFEEKSVINEGDNGIYVKVPSNKETASAVTIPMSFMTGSIPGKRFYKQATTRLADNGNGWMVMFDYRTLKTPKRPLKLPTLSLAKNIAAE